jgi:eukaryotic-like serine/threonine-protein kinase
MRLNAGDRLGPYEIEAPIGAGAMGEVYRARDTRLGRTVPIKILSGVNPVVSDRTQPIIVVLNWPAGLTR